METTIPYSAAAWHADRRFARVADLAYRAAGAVGSEVFDYINANRSELAPALSGLPCPGVAGFDD